MSWPIIRSRAIVMTKTSLYSSIVPHRPISCPRTAAQNHHPVHRIDAVMSPTTLFRKGHRIADEIRVREHRHEEASTWNLIFPRHSYRHIRSVPMDLAKLAETRSNLINCWAAQRRPGESCGSDLFWGGMASKLREPTAYTLAPVCDPRRSRFRMSTSTKWRVEETISYWTERRDICSYLWPLLPWLCCLHALVKLRLRCAS